MPKSLHEPRFVGNEWDYVKECLDSTFVSSVGKFVDRFECDLAAYTGAGYAVAVVNGTSALHISLKLVGVKPGDEVITPTLSFVAAANAITYCGAIPNFVDSDETTLGMSAQALRDYLNTVAEMRTGVCFNKQTGRPIRAMVPMHTFGHPSDLDGLLAISRDYNLALIEDAAESLGSLYFGRHTGTFGALGILSFNGNKTITTGGGGAILTNDREHAKRAKHITTTAKLPHPWAYVHDEVGYNYRMPNLNAALGCAQLESMPDFLRLKRQLFQAYKSSFSDVANIRLVEEPSGSSSNFWMQTLMLEDVDVHLRDTILNATNEAGYMTRPVWGLMHKLPHFENCPKAPLPTAESLEKRLINIPSNA
jgi:aminotransferase in exopolysaccharide biosynthesis